MTRITAATTISSTTIRTQDTHPDSHNRHQRPRKISTWLERRSSSPRVIRATNLRTGYLQTRKISRRCTCLRTTATWSSTSASPSWLRTPWATTTSILSPDATLWAQLNAWGASPTLLISTGHSSSASLACTSLQSRQRRRIRRATQSLKKGGTSLICFAKNA